MRAFIIILAIIGGLAACADSRTKQISSFVKKKGDLSKFLILLLLKS